VPVVLGAALAIGVVRNGSVAPAVLYACLLAVATNAAIAAAEFRDDPDPWTPDLYRGRRCEMAPLLGPPQWPSVERRRKPRGVVLGST
jgi:hypothetical protein